MGIADFQKKQEIDEYGSQFLGGVFTKEFEKKDGGVFKVWRFNDEATGTAYSLTLNSKHDKNNENSPRFFAAKKRFERNGEDKMIFLDSKDSPNKASNTSPADNVDSDDIPF